MASDRIVRDVTPNVVTFDMLTSSKEEGGWRYIVATYKDASVPGRRVSKEIDNEMKASQLRWALRLGAISAVRFYGSSDGGVTEKDD